MLLDPTIPSIIQGLWIAIAVVWFFRKHDELPLLISLFLAYIFSFRYWALTSGLVSPVNLSSFGFDSIDWESAIWALQVAAAGETVLLGSYLLVQRKNLVQELGTIRGGLSSRIGRFTLLLAAVILPLALGARVAVGLQLASGRSVGFEVSGYMSLFPYALIGVAVLIITAWKLGAFLRGGKPIAIIALALIAVVTYSPSSRFQFLGWLIAGVVIVCANWPAVRRVTIFAVGAVIAAALFATAGALRGELEPDESIAQSAWERFAFTEDANMLDGLALLRQVYPEQLDFRYGREHLEIFARPIPRKLWPDKPLGGYMNKLGLIDAESGFTLGISQSLFGSFYEEGALIGVIVCGILYGIGIAKLSSRSVSMHPFSGLLLRGCICAAMIPLLRGGDLPGIYAWFGMAFWPCVLAVWWYRKELAITNDGQETTVADEGFVSNPRRRSNWAALRRRPSDRKVEP